MIEGNLRINKKTLEDWMQLAQIDQITLAKEIDIDQGNFSKMLDNKIPTSKTVIEKILGRTLLPVGSILIFDLTERGA